MESEVQTWGGLRTLLAQATQPVALSQPWAVERARRVSAASLLLCAVWIVAAIWVPLEYVKAGDDAPALVTFVLIAAPVASFLAYALSRSRYTIAATAATAVTAAVATLAATMYQPDLAVPLSHLFLFASVLVLGALFMPLPYALAMASFDLVASLAAPSLIPRASAAALELPYLFLGINAVLFAAMSPLRHRDEERTTHALAAVQSTQEHAHSLRADNESKDDLLRTASHELHSPLTVIYLQLHVLRQQARAAFSPKQKHALQVLERNVHHLGTMLDDLLDKARLDAGRMPLAVQPIDVAQLVQHAAQNFEAAADQAGVILRTNAPPVTAHVDPVRMAQVLDNLVGNALKFTPRGGAIDVETSSTDTTMTLSVTDTGAGLSAEQLSRLFQPFVRVHDHLPEGPKGSGLGLAISRGLVERHGGALWAESAGPGQGTRFVATIPLQPVADQRQ